MAHTERLADAFRRTGANDRRTVVMILGAAVLLR